MKRILQYISSHFCVVCVLLVLSFLSNSGFAQTNTWDGSSSNNWNTAANWSLNLVPTAAHDVVINMNADILVNTSPIINSLTIGNSATVSFTSSGAGRTLTIDNTGSSIGYGSTLTLQGSTGTGTRSMSILFSGANNTMSIAGTLILTAVGEGTIYNASNSLTTISGLLKNDGSGTGTPGVITSTASNLSFNSGGTYEHALDGGTIPTATWNSASNCNITGVTTTVPTVANFAQAFGNFTWNCTGQSAAVSLIGNLTTINGNFTIASTGSTPQVLNLAISGATFTTTVQGDYIQSGGILTLNGTNGACTFNLAGNFNMSGGTLARGSGTGTFNFNGTSTQTFNKSGGNITGTLPFSILSGTSVDFGTSVLDGVSATFNLNSGSSIITANSDGLSSTGATGSIQVGGTRTYSTGANYTYDGTAAQVTGNGLIGANNLVVNSTNTVTLSAATAISGNLNISQGTLATDIYQITGNATGTMSMASGTMLTLGRSITPYNSIDFPTNFISANISLDPTSTVVFQSPNYQVIPSLAYGNLTLSSIAGQSKVAANNLTINGNLTIDSNTTFSLGFTLGTMNIAGQLINNGFLIFENWPSKTVTVSNNLSGSGTIDMTQLVHTLNLNGQNNSIGTLTTDTNNGTVIYGYTGSGSQQVFASANYRNLTLSGTGTKTFANTTIANGNLTINSGVIANLGTGLTHTANSLTLGGIGQPAGSWGGTASTATFKNSTYFANTTGILNVSSSSCVPGSWTGLISTDWNTAANWCDGVVPTASTNITISSGGNQPVIGVGGGLCNNITINAGASLTITGSNALTVSGDWVNNGTFTANTSTVTFNKSALQNIGTGPFYNLTLTGSGIKTLSTAITTIAGNLTLSGTATTTTAANLAITGNLILGSGTTFTTGSNFTLGVTGSSLISGTLLLAGTGAKTFTNDVTINSGGVWNETGAAAINYAGNLQNDGTTFTANTVTHTFSGTNKAISGASAISIPTATFTGNYTNGTVLTCATALSVTSPAVLTNNSTITATTALSGTGSLTQGAGSTLNLGGTAAITALDASTNSNTVTYTGSNAAIKATTYSNLTVNGSGTATIGGATVVNGAMTVSTATTNNSILTVSTSLAGANTLTNTASGTLNIGGTCTITTLVANAVGNTVNYTGTGQTLKVTAYHHLTLSGGAETFGAITTVAGNLTLSSSATATTAANLAITGNLDVGTGTTFTTGANFTLGVTGTSSITGTLTLAGTGAKSFTGNVTVNTGGVWNETGVAAINYAGNLQNDGTTFTANTGIHTFSGTTKTIGGASEIAIPNLTISGTTTNNGILTVSTTLAGASTLTNGATGTLNFGGTSITPTLTATAVGNTVNYTGSGQTLKVTAYHHLSLSGGAKTFGAITAIAGNLTLNGSATATAGAGLTIGGNVTLGTGTSFTAGAYTHNVAGDWTNNGASFTNTGSTINLNGSTQTIGGSSSTTFNNLTLGGTGTKTLGIATTTSGTLAIASSIVANLGTYTSSANTMSLGGLGVINGSWGSTSSTATNNSNSYFAATTGIINVTTSSCTPPAAPTIGTITQPSCAITTGSVALSGLPSVAWTLTASPGGATQTGSGTTATFVGLTGSTTYTFTVTPYYGCTSAASGNVIINAAPITGTWLGTTSTDWNIASNWCGGIPTASTNVTIPSGGNQPVIGAAGGLCNNITINTGATLAITGTNTLTVNGNWTNGGTFTANTSTVIFAGSAQSIGTGPFYNLTLSGSGTKTLSAANTAITGNLTLSGTATVTTAANLAITGNLNIGSGTTFATGSNFTLAVTGTSTIAGTLTLAGTGAKTFTGNVTVNTGGVWNETGVAAINYAGNLQNDGTTFTANTGIHTFSGTTKTISGASEIAIPNLTISGTTTNNGILTVSTTLAGASTLTNGATGTLNFGGTSITPTLTATAVGNTVNYTGTGQTLKVTAYHHLSLSGGSKTFGAITTVAGNLILNGSATATTAANLAISGNLNLGAGTTFATGTNFTLGVTGTSSITGTLTLAGTGTKTFSGNVTVNTGGVWNETGIAAINFAGNLQNDGTTFTANTGTHTFSGATKTISGTSPISIPTATFTGAYTNSATLTSATSLTITGVTLTNNGELTAGTALAGTGGLTNASTGILHINFTGAVGITTLTATSTGNTVDYGFAGTQTVRPITYSNLTLSNSGAKTTTGVTVNDIFSMEGTATASATPTFGAAATLQYKGSSAQTTGIEFPTTFNGTGGVIINNSNGVNLGGTRTITNGLTLTSGTFTIGSNTLSLNGPTIGGTPSNLSSTASSSLVFGGSSAGVIIPSSVSNLSNLTINNPSGVSLSSPVSTNNLTLTSGILNTSDTNLLTVTSTATFSIQSASATSYINGPLARAMLANIVADGTTYNFPVGDGANYKPLDLVNIRTGANVPIIKVTENSSGATTTDGTTISTISPRNWYVQTISGDFTSSYLSLTDTGIDLTKVIGQSTLQTGAYSSVGATNIGSSITSGLAITSNNYYAIGTALPKTFYSYQSGDWTSSSTWTKDPSGSSGIEMGVPSASDNVVILNARTVKITNDGKNCSLLEIRLGGALDLTTTKNHNFLTVTGQGLLRLSSEFFPSGNFASFVASNGGTVEYYDLNNKKISNSQLTYNNLIVSNSTTAATTVFLDNATNPINYLLNGNFDLINQSSGSLTFYFGNPTASDNLINMTVKGNFTVAPGCNIRVNNFATAHTIPDLAIGSTLPLSAYPVHTLTLNGDLTNNGSVRFTGLPSPLANAYYLLTTTASGGVNYGDVQVYFSGSTNNTLTCNGTTDFFRIVLEKGIDQTKILEVNSSSTSNFALYAPNFQGSNNFNGGPEGYGIGAYSKALYLHYGTLKLNANINIPSLTEGGQDFNLIPTACLWINGATVSTTVSGVNGTGYQAATLYGKLRISSGSLATGDAAGIVLGILGTPEIRIEGTGILDVGQAWVAAGGTNLMSFVQTGGTVNFRMRGEQQTGPMLGLNNTNTVFTMSGGTLNFSDNTFINNATDYQIMDIRTQQGNYQVTGGTVNLNLPSSTTTYTANSTVPFYNLNITNKTGSATTSIQWNTPGTDLTVLNDLSIGSGATLNLNTSTINLVVGHNFNLSTGAIYTPGNNTTTFNGTGGQVFTNAGTITTGLYNFVLSNSSNTTISNNLTVRGDLTINNSCFLNDQGYSVSVAGNVYNSGTHASQANGSIILNGTVAQIIGGSGSGIFGNLTINKTTGTCTFSANQSVTGNLRLVTGILDINRYNLKLSASSNIYDVLTGTTAPTTFGTTKMITTTGQQSDGGLTRGFNAIGSLLYPFGTSGTYHPATIAFSQAPTTWGDITIKPVALTHPFVSSSISGAMKYYWKVSSAGFSGIQPTSVSHTYQYLLADIVGTEANYITGIYNLFAWTKGATAQVDKINKKILFPSINLIDGDYTAGIPSVFTTITVYYSRQSGDWGDMATWSTTSHTGGSAAAIPGTGDVVEIGDGAGINHVVTISSNTKIVGGLKLNLGSTLDLQTYTGHNFGALSDLSVSGSGTLRISSATGTAVFPSGDFGSFLGANGGTLEYYTETNIGTAFTLPTTYTTGSTINITNYPNLILSPASGKNITFPNTDLIVLKDLNINTSGTSTSGISQLNNTGASHTLTIYGNLNVNKGNLQYTNGGSFAQNVVVNGNVTVASGATFDVAAASSATNTLTINGDLTNNGTFDMIAGSNQICNVTFTGAGNNGIKGTTAVRTDFNILTVNKGTNRNSILEATVNAFSLNAILPAALTLTNGTFRLSTNLPITLTTSNPFTIPSSGCLSVNLGTINIGAANNSAGDLLLQGRLEVMNSGIVNIGNGGGSNNDIEYASAGNPELNISGGSLNVDGQIRRSTANTLGSLWFTQSGGTITVKGKSFDNTRGMFEILNSGSQFNVSGGNLIIETSGSVTTADIYITPEISVVDNSHGGHTLTIGDANTPTGKIFKLNSTAALWNLTLDGTTYNKTAILQVNTLSILNNLTINSNGTGGSVFQANELAVTIGGSLINNNRTITSGVDQGGYQAGAVGSSQTTTFTGIGQITGTNSNLTNFANLTIGTSGTTPAITLGSNSNIYVNKDLKIISGTLADTGNTISVLGNIANFGVHTSPVTPGGGIFLIGNIEQRISGSGSGIFGNVTIGNAANAHMVDNTIVNGQLSLVGGSMYIDDYLLSLGVNATFSDFSASHMIISNGVLSDLGVQKQFSGSVTNFIYPIGTQDNYRPVTYSITSPSGGSIKVISVVQSHSADALPTNDQLNYYWKTTVTGFSGLTSSTQIYQYGINDVTGNESNYHGALYQYNGWTDYGSSVVNASTHRLIFTGSDLPGGDYTAGEAANFSTSKPRLYSTGSGNWSDGTKWSINQSGVPAYGFGPNGNPVFIQASHVITMDISGASASLVNLEGTLDLGATSHHNIGSITDTLHVGTGTIRIQSTSDGIFIFPEGNYDRFMASPGTTVELYGSNDATIPLKPGNIYKPYQNLTLSGTGIKYLSADNLKVLGNLTINIGARLNNTLYNKNQYISGNWIDLNTSPSVAGFVPGTGLITFEGSSPQTLNVANSGITENFYDFKINNPSGLTLAGGGNVKVNNLLYLQNGVIYSNSTNSFTLTNSSSSIVTGGSTSSFINGPLRKQISAGSSFTFPVGKTGTPSRYGNITLTGVADAGIWETEYFNGDPNANSPSLNRSSTLLPIDLVSSNEYWKVNGISTLSTANVTLRWDAYSGYAGSSAATRTKIRLVEWSSNQWVYRGKILNDGGDVSGTVKTDNSISLSSSTNPHWFTIGNEGLPTATITSPLTASICNDGNATTTITVALTGTAPWSLTYKLGSVTTTLSNIASSPVSIVLTSNSPGIVQPINTNTIFNFKITNINDLVGIAGISDYNTTVAITINPIPDNSISGKTYVGTGELVTYTTPADASTYAWTLNSNGSPLSGNSSSYSVTWGNNTPGPYTISLTKVGSGGCTVSNSISVTTSASPTPVVTGNQKVCAGSSGNTYSTPLVAGHDYTWTISGNGTITSGANSNSCTVTWSIVSTGNTISVKEHVTSSGNPGVSTTASFLVDVGIQPSATIPSFSFPTAVCNGNTATITINNSEIGVRYQLRLNSDNSFVGIGVDGTGGTINLTSTALATNTTFNIYAYTLAPFNCAIQLTNPSSTFTVTVNPIPSITNAATASTCNGAGPNITLTASVPSNFVWTIGTITGNITGASASSGSTINQVLINPSNATTGTVQYIVTPTSTTGSCVGSPFTITVTVNPTSVITSASTVNWCNNVSNTYTATSSSSTATYAWTRAAVAGISNSAGSGTGATITETLVNTTTEPLVVHYLITPSVNGCVGTQHNVSVTVNPTSVITSASTANWCNNVSNTYTATTSTSASTTYAWTRAAVVGISNSAGSGTGATITETLVNTTTEPVVVHYLITPSVNGCAGTQYNVSVTVNPTAVITSSATANWCSNSLNTYTATSSSSTATFAWTRAVVSGISNLAGSGTGATITETLVNTTNSLVIVHYLITPIVNSCLGNTLDVSVKVYPKPNIANKTATTCSGTGFTVSPVNGIDIVPVGTTYSWSAPVVTGINGTAVGSNATNISGSLTNTTNAAIDVTYTVTPQSGSCSGSTFTVTVTVNPVPAISTITTTVCSGRNFAVIPVNSTNGIVPAGSTYSCPEPSVTGGLTGGAVIVGAGSISGTLINPTNTAQTATYLVLPKSGTCFGSIFTVTVTVDPVPDINSKFITICSAGSFSFTPVNVTNGIVPSGTTYSWSAPSVTGGLTGGMSAIDATSITGSLINPTNEIQTATYTITPTSGSCSGNTFTVTITVNPDGSWTGAIDSNWNNPGNWACNEIPSITTNVIIGNGRIPYPILSSGADGTTKNLTIENNASLTVTGNTLQVAGTISNTGTFIATSGTIEMRGTTAQTIGSNVFTGNTIMNLTNDNPAGTTLLGPLKVTGIVLALHGNFDSGGNLTLVSTATQTALIDGTGFGDVLGNVNMQRYLSSAFGYKYFSSPFQTATVSEFSPEVDLNAIFPTFYNYIEDNSIDSSGVTVYKSGWSKYINSGNLLVPLSGYSANFGPLIPAKTFEMTGVVNNRNLQVDLYNHNRKYTKGFNLVGNPYPSPIDWNASGWTKTNIDNAIYFFNASGTQYSGSYSSYVNGVSNGADNIIAAMQGFFVHVADLNGTYPVTGTLGVSNSVRINNLNPSFKYAFIDDRPILRFTANFETKNALDDAAVIYFDNTAHLCFDKDKDALKMKNTDLLVPNLYTLTPESIQLSINGMPYPSDSISSIPLGITTLTDGWLIFKANDITQLPTTMQIYLVDNESGNTLWDLRQLPEYRFYLKSGEYNQRFKLVFSLSNLTDPIANGKKMFVLSRSGNILFVKVNLPINGRGGLTVTNMLGQVLIRREVFGKETVEINQSISAGVYVVTLISGNKAESEKILMRRDYE